MITQFGPGPQGLDVKPLRDAGGHVVPHNFILGETFIDPASLRRPDGGDPFLVLADGRTVRQVRADHAAELLLPEVDGRHKFRLATDEEVAAHLASEQRKADEYRAAEVARINREADELRAQRLAELDRLQELEAAKSQVSQR